MYICDPMYICFRRFAQVTLYVDAIAFSNAGRSIAASTLMIAITTSSSTKVKPLFADFIVPLPLVNIIFKIA
jgi:hypothetical protein